MKAVYRHLWGAAVVGSAVLSMTAATYTEPYRPQVHFTPERNWMNDPNGMVFHDGEYHLFYQYNPFGDRWGHMSWGHAVSEDLIHWEHLPVALREENGVMIFSGSAVVDWKNTSGFGRDGRPSLVAIYTGHYTEKRLQDQQIAYSDDRGRTWTKYEGNPVLDIGKADFRDPKVMWHEGTGQWIMTVALPVDRKVQFYGSPNLKEWEWLSEFGPAGAVRGIWECPDLFPLQVEGENESKWVLIVNIGGESVAGGSGCQYFVGEFDGRRFTPAQRAESSAGAPAVAGETFMDFEGSDYGRWTATGDAFGERPANGTLPGQQPVAGFEGAGLVNTYRNGDVSTGTMTSPEFEIRNDFINFLIGGGAHPGETCMNLLVDGGVIRTATGNNSERLDWRSWEVAELRGKTARLEIVDRSAEGWGHINIDQIIFADAPARPAGEMAYWVDYAKDFYAAVSWSDIPKEDGRRLWIGWMSNWQYANDAPTSPWRSAMSVPRSLTLRRAEGDWRLVQRPVKELEGLRREEETGRYRGVEGEVDLSRFEDVGKAPIEIGFSCKPSAGAVIVLRRKTGADESVVVKWDVGQGRMVLDRRRAGRSDFSDQFPGVFEAPIRMIDGRLTARLFIDTSSVEVFVNDGETVMTSLMFPEGNSPGLGMEVAAGTLEELELKVWPLKSIWNAGR